MCRKIVSGKFHKYGVFHWIFCDVYVVVVVGKVLGRMPRVFLVPVHEFIGH